MYDFLNQNQMYIVLIVTLIVWGGIVVYLFRLDNKIKQLENKFKEKE